MNSIKETIMERDNITEAEADTLIEMAVEELRESYDNEICEKWFGLEADYIWDLMEKM